MVTGIPLAIKIIFFNHVGPYLHVVMVMHQYTLLLFSGFMGISIFLSDSRQRADDYTASLPYSRLQLLLMKVLPRFAAVLVFYLAFVVMYLAMGKMVLMPHGFFAATWFCWLLFAVTLSFSASVESYFWALALAAAGLLVPTFLLNLSFKLNILIREGAAKLLEQGAWQFFSIQFDNLPSGFLMASIVLILPFLIAFVRTYLKWGLYSKPNYNRAFFKVFLPLLAVGFVFSIFYVSVASKWASPPAYYLTLDHNLIEAGDDYTQMYNSAGDVTLTYNQGRFNYVHEDERFVYGYHTTSGSDHVIRIDKEKQAVEVLHKGRAPDQFRFLFYLAIYEHIIVVPSEYSSGIFRAFHVIDTQTRQVNVMQFADVLPRGYNQPIIFGADRMNGKLFWLVRTAWGGNTPVIRVWQDGKWENLGVTASKPYYLNRLLVTRDETGLVFSKLKEQGMEEVKRIPVKPRSFFEILYTPSRLDNVPLKEVYVSSRSRQFPNFSRLDLETFEVSPVTDRPRGTLQFVKYDPPGEMIIFSFEKGDRGDGGLSFKNGKYYRVKNSRFTLLKEFPGDWEIRPSGRWQTLGGIVVKRGETPEAFAFPDFEPVGFNIVK